MRKRFNTFLDKPSSWGIAGAGIVLALIGQTIIENRGNTHSQAMGILEARAHDTAVADGGVDVGLSFDGGATSEPFDDSPDGGEKKLVVPSAPAKSSEDQPVFPAPSWATPTAAPTSSTTPFIMAPEHFVN